MNYLNYYYLYIIIRDVNYYYLNIIISYVNN